MKFYKVALRDGIEYSDNAPSYIYAEDVIYNGCIDFMPSKKHVVDGPDSLYDYHYEDVYEGKTQIIVYEENGVLRDLVLGKEVRYDKSKAYQFPNPNYPDSLEELKKEYDDKGLVCFEKEEITDNTSVADYLRVIENDSNVLEKYIQCIEELETRAKLRDFIIIKLEYLEKQNKIKEQDNKDRDYVLKYIKNRNK